MDLESVLEAYRRHAPYYDAVFGLLLGPGRRETVRLANRVARRRVLEIGVGTGLSLPGYRTDIGIVGIDVSEPMLRIARHRVAEQRLRNVEALLDMDAEALEFEDDSFDTVVAMYVASVVPDPQRFLREARRVCKPGGRILIVNHFAETGGVRGTVERRLAPLSRKLGWRPDFELRPFLSDPGLEVQGIRQVPPLGLFTILNCRNDKPDAAAAATAATPAAFADHTGR